MMPFRAVRLTFPVVAALPDNWTRPALVTVSVPRGAAPPIAEVKWTLPPVPAFTLRLSPAPPAVPSTAPLKVMPASLVVPSVSSVAVAPSAMETGPLKVKVPAVPSSSVLTLAARTMLAPDVSERLSP